MDKLIYGADTETVHGKPNSLQFYSEDVACDDIYFVNEKDAMQRFLAWCASRKRNVQHVVYIHNLGFDLIEFLWGKHEKLVESGSEFDFNVRQKGGTDWRVKGFYGSPTFCSVSSGHDRRIVLVDSFSFYRGSLASAAKLFCPDLPKLSRPSDLGNRRYTARDAGFVQYAMRDAEVTYHIGRAIEELHKEFDLQQCISAADLAARIFRHRFLTYTIPQPTQDIVYAALDSYHGGKNNLTCDAGWYEGVTGVDISSAYPHAMRDLPAFSAGKLYKNFRAKRGTSKRIDSVPPYGVYLVNGRVSDCAWPVLFDHSFRPLSGEVDDTWVQGFELNEALRSGEFKLSSLSGYYYDADKDHQAPGLRAFCDDFYRRKQTEKDKVRRSGYKLILNSISGKFIQTRKRTLRCYVDIDSGEVTDAAELVAGGMFHPFIASAITAHTRARIHRLEHHFKALHTATDGIFTQASTSTKRGNWRVVSKATELGELEVDEPSPVLIVRNKCYIKYTADSTSRDDSIPSKSFDGQHIQKWALHGFQGTVHDLEALIATGRRKYSVSRANRLKESIKRGLVPNDFVNRDYTLKVGPIHVHTSRSTPKQKKRAIKR